MKKVLILIFSLVLLSAFAFPGYDNSEAEKFEPKYYDDAKVLRVKYTQGEAFVKRSYDEGFEEASLNLPIFEKDAAGTTDGRLEVYLGRLNYLRFDYDTEVVFDKAPELQKTGMTLRVTKGGIYLDIENLDFERDIEIQTPDCGIFLLDKGLYRINVNEGGRTELFVFDGIAEVAGRDFNRNVRENQKIIMFDGEVKERPFYFYASNSDDFDRWNRKRNSTVGYSRYSSSRYLDEGYEDYEYELSRSGRWRYDSEYGKYVWIPYNVDEDWRPYYHGRWIWNPHYGRTWMSYDSWGSFTHHYGRWHWDPLYHWYWIPGYRWSPAWVSWFWDDHYYGWCPLSYWNRPVVVYGGRWWRNHHYRRHGVPFHARSTTIIRKSQLSSSGVHRVALKRGVAGKISKKALRFKGHGPGVKPTHSKIKVINARGKSVVYKKNGIVSSTKYRKLKSGSTVSNVRNKSTPVYKYSNTKKISKQKTSKYSKSPYTKSPSSTRKLKSKSSKYKYKPSQSSTSDKQRKYGSSPATRLKKGESVSDFSKYKYKPKTSSKTKKSTRSSSKASSKASSKKKSSSGNYKKLKKKKENSPSYSYKPSTSASSYSHSGSSSTPSSTYSSKKKSSYSYSSPKKSRSSYKAYSSKSYKTYKPSSSYKRKTASSSSSYSSPSSSSRSPYKSSYKSSYKKSPSRSSYKSPSRSYSKPSSSYRSSSRSSSGSRGSSSYKSSPRRSSSSSSSRSSRSSSRSSKSSSSSSSFKKKK